MKVFWAPVHRFLIRCLFPCLPLVLQVSAVAQVSPTLVVSPVSGSPGTTVTANISLSGGSSIPASLEWTISYPKDFPAASLNIGASALAAGKFISCSASTGSAKCLVWGPNANIISDGVIAVMSLTLSESTASTSAQIDVGGANASNARGEAIPLSGSSGTVSIVQIAVLTGISCTSTTLIYPSETACTVTLNAGAPSGGAAVALSISPAGATVDSLVVIPEGSSSGTFSVAAQPGAAGAVTLTASYNGATQSLALAINPWRPKKRIIPLHAK